MTSYSDKLKHPKWQRKRLEILQRDDFKCTLCSDKETELHVHHKKYTKEPHDAPNEDLVTLCKHCHEFETLCNKHANDTISSAYEIVNERSLFKFYKTKKGKFIISTFQQEEIGLINDLIIIDYTELMTILNKMT